MEDNEWRYQQLKTQLDEWLGDNEMLQDIVDEDLIEAFGEGQYDAYREGWLSEASKAEIENAETRFLMKVLSRLFTELASTATEAFRRV